MIHSEVTPRKTIVAWVALVVLTLVSLAMSRVGLAGGPELAVALVIAFVKALIVLFLFMHLIEQRFANRLIVIVTFLFIVLLVSLTVADPLTRKTFPRAPEPSARPLQ